MSMSRVLSEQEQLRRNSLAQLRKLGGEKLEKNDLLELIGSEHPASLWSAHHLLELHKPSLAEEKE